MIRGRCPVSSRAADRFDALFSDTIVVSVDLDLDLPGKCKMPQSGWADQWEEKLKAAEKESRKHEIAVQPYSIACYQ